MSKFSSDIASLKNEIKSHKVVYLLLAFILIAEFLLRIHRINDLLGFYYDQGRDALKIWDLWHKGDVFLIGPTTGIAGIFRGPYYYYLIAPFYLIGNGNPVYPSIFLSFTTVTASLFTYILGAKIMNRPAGIFAATLSAFSFFIFTAARWLSNPTPMLLLSMILVFGMYVVSTGKRWGWPIIALTSGLSLFNFGSSGEVFYYPALLIFAIWQRKNWPDLKNLILSVLLFTSTFFPLVVFDIKNNGLLRNNIFHSFVSEKSFAMATQFLTGERNKVYYEVASKILFHSRGSLEFYLLLSLIVIFFLTLIRLVRNDGYKIILILLLSVLFGLYFFRGNNGVLYDYYLTGYYLIFVLLVGILLGFVWKYNLGRIFVIVFLAAFLANNLDVINNRLTETGVGPETIIFANQKAAIDWIFTDSNGQWFSTDVYVPPVIPYAYDYLFTWYYDRIEDGDFLNRMQDGDLNRPNIPLYTLYEVDPPHPERLEAWLARQRGIGRVEKEIRFGGIVVQRRIRI